MIRPPALQMRPFAAPDRRKVERLLDRSPKVHTHLDWEEPQTWFRRPPTMLAFRGRALVGVLSAPPDPPDVAWVRLAAVSAGVPPATALDRLWQAVRADLVNRETCRAAALTLDPWMEPLLGRWGFAQSHSVVALSRNNRPPPEMPLVAARIRLARKADLSAIGTADNAAFEAPWALSAQALQAALARGAYATVAELDGAVVGYQITTGGRYGAHLARLAVLPALQGRRIGRALVADMLRHFDRLGAPAVGVNTQDNNAASLALYEALEFHFTGESYPVWQLHLV
ncbi:MAG: GNAT family N-acetyltransferase [Anaerolineales bacterium]